MSNWFKRFEITLSIFLVLIALVFFVRAINENQLDASLSENTDLEDFNANGFVASEITNEKVISGEGEIKVVLIDEDESDISNDVPQDMEKSSSKSKKHNIAIKEEDLTNVELFLTLNGDSANVDLVYGENVSVLANSSYGSFTLYRNGEDVSQEGNGENVLLNAGLYNYTLIGESNTSLTYFLNISKRDSSYSMFINGTTPIVFGNLSDFLGYENNLGDEGCNYSLSRNNDVYGVGVVTFNYSTTGCSNFNAGSVVKDLVVNKAVPYTMFIGISPSNILSYSNLTSAAGFGCPAYTVCKLYRNGVEKANPDIVTLGAGTYTYNYSTSGNSNYSAYSVYSNITILSNASSSYVDSQKPTVSLSKPEDGDLIESEKVEFVFSVQDNIKISNCTFSLYYYNNSASIGSLVYSEIRNAITNNASNSITLHDFDEGEYSWDVGCFDNSSNYHERGRDFYYEKNTSITVDSKKTNQSLQTISLDSTSYVYEDEISSLISDINDFLIKEEKYGPDELAAIENMGLTENLRFYKKKLLQIKSDMDHNLDFVNDPSKKAERERQIKLDLEEIKNNIPFDIKILDKKSYSKNTLENEVKESIRDYLTKKNIFMEDRALDILMEKVKSSQNSLIIESEAKKIEITYTNDKSEVFVLVDKKITIKNKENFDSIIEIIPKSVSSNASNVHFINENVVIKEDPIFEISLNSLNNDKLTYYIRGGSFSDIEKIDSVIFGEDTLISGSKNSGITGFAIIYQGMNGGLGFYISWIIVLAIIVFAIYYYLNAKKMSKLKGNGDFRNALTQIKLAKQYLNSNELALAREHYYNLKSIYSKLNGDMKKIIYGSILKIQSNLDKKEISGLLRECIMAIKERRMQDANLVYQKIKPIYGRLPSNYREKIYSKIMPFVN